eukprot:1161563-Pelagomonas_calceolata.AAC.2
MVKVQFAWWIASWGIDMTWMLRLSELELLEYFMHKGIAQCSIVRETSCYIILPQGRRQACLGAKWNNQGNHLEVDKGQFLSKMDVEIVCCIRVTSTFSREVYWCQGGAVGFLSE